MAENFIQLPADSSGKKVRSFNITVGANDVHHQAFVVTDSAGNIVDTLTSAPAGTERAITVRQVGSHAVTGTFWQATQPVSIASMPSTPVTGTFWQATQPVSLATNAPDVIDRAARLLGHVTVDNASLAVTQSTAAAATAPWSTRLSDGAAFYKTNSDTQLPGSLGTKVSTASLGVVLASDHASIPVSGTFWQATQPVSGTFWQATQPVSGPLTDTQLRASAVPVSLATAPTTPVTGTFWQATQPISAAALPLPSGAAQDSTLTGGTQKAILRTAAKGTTVAADVTSTPTDANTQSLDVSVKGTVPVSGTFYQATQPVSIASMPSTPVTGTFWQATQPVSLATNTPDITDRVGRLLGHVTVDNASIAVTGSFYQATQPVSIASMPTTAVTGPLTDTQLRASAVPVSGTFYQATQPVSLATNTPDVTDRVGRLLGHVTVDNASLAVTGTFYQATQPVSIATLPALAAGTNAIGDVGVVTTTTGAQVLSAAPASDTGQRALAVRVISQLGAGSGGLTNTELRAAPVPIIDADATASGTISATDAVMGTYLGDGSLKTGTPTANSYILLPLTGGESAFTVMFTGTFGGGTVWQEVSADSTNGINGSWTTALGRQSGNNSTFLDESIQTAGIYRGNASGMTYVRWRITGATTPSVAIVARASAGSGATFLNASIPAGSNTIGSVGSRLDAVQNATLTPTLNNTYSIPLAGQAKLTIKVSGIAGGATLTPEASADGGVTWFSNSLYYVTLSSSASGVNSDGTYEALVTGFTHFRMRVNTAGTGTITISYALSANTHLVGVRGAVAGGPVKDTNYSSALTTITSPPTGGGANTTGIGLDTNNENNMSISVAGTWTGAPVMTFEGSADYGATWWPTLARRHDSGIAESSATLAVGTVRSWDIPCSGFTHTRARLTTAPASGSVSTRLMSTGDGGTPVVAAIVQSPPRVSMVLSTASAGVVPAAADTLVTMAQSQRNYAALGSASTFAITAGKTFRVQAMSLGIRATAATAVTVTAFLRYNPTGAVTATSPIIATLSAGTGGAVIGVGQGTAITFADGKDMPAITGAGQVGVSMIGSSATGIANISIEGYEF